MSDSAHHTDTSPAPGMRDILAMPNRPKLNYDSILKLIGQYRELRALHPDIFDSDTELIKDIMTRFKNKEGGSDELHLNEYTVGLACRLDAAALDDWLTSQEHKQQDHNKNEGGNKAQVKGDDKGKDTLRSVTRADEDDDTNFQELDNIVAKSEGAEDAADAQGQ